MSARTIWRASPLQLNAERSNILHAGTVGVIATIREACPMNPMTKAVGMQQPVHTGLECPWDHTCQGVSIARLNNPSAGSVRMSVILEENAEGDTHRNTSQKRSIEKQVEEMKKVPAPSHPHSACQERTVMTVSVKGWTGGKACLVTIDIGASV
jgi:hypothetical protein